MDRKMRAILVLAALVATTQAGDSHAQSWSLDGGGPMRIPSIDELSRPGATRSTIRPPVDQQAGPLGPFLNDSTLRRGDIVVTPDGAMSFQGRDALSHRQEDFAPAPQSPPIQKQRDR